MGSGGSMCRWCENFALARTRGLASVAMSGNHGLRPWLESFDGGIAAGLGAKRFDRIVAYGFGSVVDEQ